MSDFQQAQPGWYPTDDGYQRYWDGHQWTEHRAPLQSAAPQPYQGQPNQGQPGAYQPQDTPYQGGQYPGGVSTSNDNGIAVLAHLGGMFFGFLVPLVIYLIKKDESPYLRHHSSEALNFQITVFIAAMVSIILIFVIIGIFLILAVVIGSWVLAIIASIAANKGEWYRYPMTIRMIS